MTRREEIIALAGQAINGMLSSDSSILSKLAVYGDENLVSTVAVKIAEKALEKIDKIVNEDSIT